MTSDRRLLILYGSETGYAQETAERIKREAQKRSFLVELMPMDEYNIANLPTENLVALVCSVTGQGEEPTNMKVRSINAAFLEIFVEEITAGRLIVSSIIRSLWTG